MKPDHVPEWGSFIVPYGARIVAPPGPDELAAYAPRRPSTGVRQRIEEIDALVAELLEERARLVSPLPSLGTTGGVE